MTDHPFAHPSSFAPRDLAVLQKAFDIAWGSVAGNCPVDVSEARDELARIVVELADEEPLDAAALATTALAHFALAHSAG